MVVLQEQPVRVLRVARDLVHALAELGQRVGEEVGPHAGVGRRPGRTGVVGAVDAAGGHRDEHPLWVVGVRLQRVDRGTAEAGTPFRAVRVIPERADEAEVLAAVVAAEQALRLAAGPDDAGLAGRGMQLPDARERGVGVGGERYGALVGLDPGGAEVVAMEHRRTPVLAGRRGEQPRRGTAGVDGDGVDAVHQEVRFGQFPGGAVGAAGEEQALGGTDREQYISHARQPGTDLRHRPVPRR